ncbi:MAG TPA: hypothetical protein VEL07_16525 [Planctomycetota bacterium]|nr:hypothetical protein [Planctomycetota bacterium]
MPIHAAATRPLALLAVTIAVLAAAAKDVPLVVAPSANKGKLDAYHVQTGIPGASYNVNAKFYDAERPAGLHVYFGSEGAKEKDETWREFEEPALKRHNLVGINLAFKDGDYRQDTSGKIKAARIACAQVIADYPRIIPGRGILAAFSQGGVAVAQWVAAGKEPSPAFPFSHVSLYSTEFRGTPPEGGGLSWFIGLGIKEWEHGEQMTASQYARDLMQQLLLQAAKKNGCQDVYLSLWDKGHELKIAEVAASSEVFARSEIALAPFVHPADFADGPAAKWVAAANAHAFGAALNGLDKLIDEPKTAESDRVRLMDLRGRIAGRIEDLAGLVESLRESDPMLAAYYARLGSAQLGKHEKAAQFTAVLSALAKDDLYVKAARAHEAFVTAFASFMPPKPILAPAQKDLAAQISAAGPENAATMRMARAFCALPAR